MPNTAAVAYRVSRVGECHVGATLLLRNRFFRLTLADDAKSHHKSRQKNPNHPAIVSWETSAAFAFLAPCASLLCQFN